MIVRWAFSNQHSSEKKKTKTIINRILCFSESLTKNLVIFSANWWPIIKNLAHPINRWMTFSKQCSKHKIPTVISIFSPFTPIHGPCPIPIDEYRSYFRRQRWWGFNRTFRNIIFRRIGNIEHIILVCTLRIGKKSKCTRSSLRRSMRKTREKQWWTHVRCIEWNEIFGKCFLRGTSSAYTGTLFGQMLLAKLHITKHRKQCTGYNYTRHCRSYSRSSIAFVSFLFVNSSFLFYIHFVWFYSDPEHFPEPEKFIPDRFDDPAVRNSPIYLPFGCGPRICIGMRFASAQVRLALFNVVKHFQLSVSPNHKPLVISPVGFMLQPKDGILINFKQRVDVKDK